VTEAQAATTEVPQSEEEIEDFTPSRFRTSMRPAAPRPALQITDVPSPNTFTPTVPSGFASALQPADNTTLAPQFTLAVTETARTIDQTSTTAEPETIVAATDKETIARGQSSTQLESQPDNLSAVPTAASPIQAVTDEPTNVAPASIAPTNVASAQREEPAPVSATEVSATEVSAPPAVSSSPTTPKKSKPKW
jgi:hypothetical protein